MRLLVPPTWPEPHLSTVVSSADYKAYILHSREEFFKAKHFPLGRTKDLKDDLPLFSFNNECLLTFLKMRA